MKIISMKMAKTIISVMASKIINSNNSESENNEISSAKRKAKIMKINNEMA
jgi:hypothetical protein